MAQQDTGLGWSAEQDWLVSVPATIANLQTFDDTNFPGQPALEGSTQADFAAGGFTYGSGFYSWYLYMSGPEGPVFAFVYDRFTMVFCSPVERATFYTGFKDKDTGRIGGTISHETCSSQNSGWWYWTSRYSSDFTASVPSFGSVTQGITALKAAMTNAPFNKINSGYAVGCVAKWVTPNGVTIQTPILISSNTDYTDMETTLTGVYIAKLNHLLSGVRFYMAFYDYTGSESIAPNNLPTADLTDKGLLSLDQVFMYIISTSYAHVIIISSPDPYEEEGAGSGEEGGDGEELEDDEMGISHHAIPAAINTGFCRIYCPSEQQLRDLSNFLWSAQFDLTAVKKLFANPMDSVLGLSAVPLTLSGANAAVYLGGVDTEMSFPMVSYQSYQVPMGAITVEKRWGSYLDYDPYTKFSIYLPFIGFKDLSADDIMGKQIILDYDVDILSGACTARLQAGANVLYQWSGQCSIQLPVTASNWNQVFQNATSAALSAGLAVATGTAGPVLAGALAAEGAQAIMGKPRIERGGTASGAAGWMGGLTPYLVRVTPEAVIPGDQNKFIGYPAFSSISLGALTGYNEISSIHLEGIPATGAELDELEAILKGGVIF